MLLGGALGNLADRGARGRGDRLHRPDRLAGLQRGRRLHRGRGARAAVRRRATSRRRRRGAQRRATVGDARAPTRTPALRLDAFLAAHDAAPSRAAAQRLIEAGAVAVDGARAAEEPPAGRRGGDRDRRARGRAEPSPEPVEFEVVYEDDDLLVVDKPAGLVVHPAPGPRTARRSPRRWRAARPADPTRSAPGSCTGSTATPPACCVVAKSEAAHAALQAACCARARSSASTWRSSTGHPDAEQRHDRRPDRPRPRAPHAAVRRAPTARARRSPTSRSLERLPRTALLRVRLETGRTHQIRAHLAAIGHPVCGDAPYGGGASGRRLGLKRQFLHASRLMFRHPVTGADDRVRVQTTRRSTSCARRSQTGASLRRARRRLRHTSEAAFGPPRLVRLSRLSFAATGSPRPRREHRARPCPARRTRVRAPAGGQPHNHNHQGSITWPQTLASRSCWRPASTSATRRAAGTRRCAASSSASATASTSSTCRRPSACCTRRRSSSARSPGRGGTVLFVGTKKQARDTIEEAARALRHAVRQPALARRPADQLPDDLQAHHAPARAARVDRERHDGPAAGARAHRRR